MTTYKLVMPADMNPYGFLFGGNMLQWVDEYAWMAASHDYPHMRFVTVGMDRVAFKKQVPVGAILCFETVRCRCGRTSVAYNVTVTNSTAGDEVLFETEITFVRVDESGAKLPLDA